MNRIVHTSLRLVLMAGLVVFEGWVAAPVMAATITYNFTGTVNQVGNQVSSQFTNPSSMSGSITVNNHTPVPPGLTESYSIRNLQLTIGGYTASFNPPPPNGTGSSSGVGVVDIRNGTGGGAGADRFEVTVNSPDGNPVNFLVPRLFEINLRGPGGQWTTDALPSPVPSIASFTGANSFRLQFGPNNGLPPRVSGFLTSLTAVPLPPAVILFGVGLVALIGLGAGGLRNLRLPQA